MAGNKVIERTTSVSEGQGEGDTNGACAEAASSSSHLLSAGNEGGSRESALQPEIKLLASRPHSGANVICAGKVTYFINLGGRVELGCLRDVSVVLQHGQKLGQKEAWSVRGTAHPTQSLEGSLEASLFRAPDSNLIPDPKVTQVGPVAPPPPTIRKGFSKDSRMLRAFFWAVVKGTLASSSALGSCGRRWKVCDIET